jgi:thiol:disulfide interchange protein DsbC
MKKLFVLFLSVLFLLPACSSLQKISPEEQFKKNYPQNTYETFTPTSIRGIYEVYNGRQVYYYLQEGDFLLLGNIISKDGKNLTQESNSKRVASKLVNLPLDQALKVGSGKTTVVEFIDPNCHYCRLSFDFFAKRKNDVTLYVFFFPLSEDSERKIRHIFCAKDKAKAYEDALSGKLDGSDKLNLCSDKGVEDIMKSHQQIGAKVGIRATPLFYIKGQVVNGFDQPVIEKLLTD